MASAEQLKRLQAVVPAAQASCRKWGVPVAVTLAQWIFESAWGTSQLSLKANNFFGVKWSQARSESEYAEFPTAEYVSGKKVIISAKFVKYPSAEDGFEDHARLLALSKRYAPAMKFSADPMAFAEQLQTCGYSTAPNYAASLQAAIRNYGLLAYEIAPALSEPPTKEAFDAAVEKSGLV